MKKKIAIYHDIRAGDTFDDIAQHLFGLVRKAIDANPGATRWLYLDIEGHTDPETGYDRDVCEILLTFIPQMLGPHLNRFPSATLDDKGHLRITGQINNPRQTDDLPPALTIEELAPWPAKLPSWVRDR